MPLLPSQINPQGMPWTDWLSGAVQQSNFLCDRVFNSANTRIDLGRIGSRIAIYNTDPQNFLGNPGIDLRRAPGASLIDIGLRRGNWVDTFDIPERAPFALVDRIEEAAGFPLVDLQAQRLLEVEMVARIEREVQCATLFGATTTIPWATSSWANIPATFGGGAGGFAQLADNAPATGNPVTVLSALRATVRGNAHGLAPTHLILPYRVAQCLMQHEQVLGATAAGAASRAFADIIISSPGDLETRLSMLVGIPNVLIFESVRRTNNIGQANASEDFIDAVASSGEWVWMGVLGATVQAVNGQGGVKLVGGGVIEAVLVDNEPSVILNEQQTGYICTVRTQRAYCEIGRQRASSNPAGAVATNPYGYLATNVMA